MLMRSSMSGFSDRVCDGCMSKGENGTIKDERKIMVFKYLSMSMTLLCLVVTMTLGSMAFAGEPSAPVSLSKIFETTQYGYTLQVTSPTGAAFVHDGKMYVQEGVEYTFRLTCTEADKWYIGIQPTQDDGITLDYDKRNGSQSGAGPNSTYIDITKTFTTAGTHVIAKAFYYEGASFSRLSMTTVDIEVNIIKVELVKADSQAYTDADIFPNVCQNAQVVYKKARWKAIVKPSGSAKIAYTGGIAINRSSVRDEGIVEVTAANKTGYYTLTIAHPLLKTCTATVTGTVFQLELHVDQEPKTENPPNIAPKLGTFYYNYDSDYGLGSTVEFAYMKQSEVRTNPKIEWNFRVKTRFSHSIKTYMQADYSGSSELPSFWSTVALSQEWKDLKACNSIVGGGTVGKVMAVVEFAMSLADNSKHQYNALGVGKSSFDVEGKSFGFGTDHKVAVAEVDLSKLDKYCYEQIQLAKGTPTRPLPLLSTAPHTSVGTGGSKVFVEQLYEQGKRREINAGFDFEFKTKAPYKWQYEGYSLPNYVWHAGGIDVTSTKIQLYNWKVTSTGFFEITGLLQ
jgi:hypothetical protein